MADCKKYNGSTWQHSLRKLTTSTDTITTLPADIYPNAATATVGLKGNMQQTGTPTPTTPIQPQETGERTGNLFDKSKKTDNSRVVYTTGEISALNGVFVSDFTPIEPNTTYTLNIVSGISGKTGHLFALYDENKNFVDTGTHEATAAKVYTFTTPSNVAYIRFNGNMVSVDEIMLNTGSTALPYEPYGIKIPISSANTTTPVYLGEIESTRRIKKLVLTGGEETNFYIKNTTSADDNSLYYIRFAMLQSVPLNGSPLYCTHLQNLNYTPSEEVGINISVIYNVIYFNLGLDVMNAQSSGNTIAGLKEYLAAQYAAGTPVTVWYVLATPETAIVNEPIRKIGDYADEVSGISIPVTTGGDTISVDTTVQPSEVTANYKGWHPAIVHERENGAWT